MKDLMVSVIQTLSHFFVQSVVQIMTPAKAYNMLMILIHEIGIKKPKEFQNISDMFNTAKHHAKITGKMVAISLALGYPFSTQSISLIGFSLGC